MTKSKHLRQPLPDPPSPGMVAAVTDAFIQGGRPLRPPTPLHALRRQFGVSAKTLGITIGVSHGVIPFWESGFRFPTRAHARAWLIVLDRMAAASPKLTQAQRAAIEAIRVIADEKTASAGDMPKAVHGSGGTASAGRPTS
jgi:DNA-binding transcriptional regulator YiaG